MDSTEELYQVFSNIFTEKFHSSPNVNQYVVLNYNEMHTKPQRLEGRFTTSQDISSGRFCIYLERELW